MNNTIVLTKRERMELTRQARSRTGRAETARRARVILLLAKGATWETVCQALGCSRGFVANWRQRFTASLYAAFNTQTGEVLGKTAARHTSEQFVAFLTDLMANQPSGKAIHVIADNLSAHKTKRVTEFLQTHSQVHLHFTPTYSS